MNRKYLLDEALLPKRHFSSLGYGHRHPGVIPMKERFHTHNVGSSKKAEGGSPHRAMFKSQERLPPS